MKFTKKQIMKAFNKMMRFTVKYGSKCKFRKCFNKWLDEEKNERSKPQKMLYV